LATPAFPLIVLIFQALGKSYIELTEENQTLPRFSQSSLTKYGAPQSMVDRDRRLAKKMGALP